MSLEQKEIKMLQVSADYCVKGTAEKLKKEFGWNHVAPGLYRTETDTVLVMALPPELSNPKDFDHPEEVDLSKINVWKYEWPEGTIFEAHVYNQPWENTIFSRISTAPGRQKKGEAMEIIIALFVLGAIGALFGKNTWACYVCSAEISRNAKTCPHCGEPFDE
jgi:hypothetical protein